MHKDVQLHDDSISIFVQQCTRSRICSRFVQMNAKHTVNVRNIYLLRRRRRKRHSWRLECVLFVQLDLHSLALSFSLSLHLDSLCSVRFVAGTEEFNSSLLSMCPCIYVWAITAQLRFLQTEQKQKIDERKNSLETQVASIIYGLYDACKRSFISVDVAHVSRSEWKWCCTCRFQFTLNAHVLATWGYLVFRLNSRRLCD